MMIVMGSVCEKSGIKNRGITCETAGFLGNATSFLSSIMSKSSIRYLVQRSSVQRLVLDAPVWPSDIPSIMSQSSVDSRFKIF
jgi:hypothetical protein